MANTSSVKKVIEDQDVVYLEDDIEAYRHHNRGAQAQNPLAGISPQELEAQVDVFCDKFGFQDHLTVFRRAALVAQNPDKIESIDGLTEDDRYWLQLEHTSRLIVKSRRCPLSYTHCRAMKTPVDDVHVHWHCLDRICNPVSLPYSSKQALADALSTEAGTILEQMGPISHTPKNLALQTVLGSSE